MAKLIYIFSLVIVCSVITANARQCYVCNNCPTVDSSNIATCPIPTTTTTVPSTPTSVSDSTSTSTSTSVSDSTSTSTSTVSTVSEGNGPSTETTGSGEDPPSGDASLPAETLFRGKRSVMQSLREADEEDIRVGCIELVVEVAGTTNIVRNCHYSLPGTVQEDNDEICRQVGAVGEIKKCNICYEDLCNASDKATATIALIAASLITTFFYIKQ